MAARYYFDRSELTGVDIDSKLVDYKNKNELVLPGTVSIGGTSDYGDHKLSRIDQTLLKFGWSFPPKTSFILTVIASLGSSTTYPIYETLTLPNPVIYSGASQIYPIRTAILFKNRRRETDLYKYMDINCYFEFSLIRPQDLFFSLYVNWVEGFKTNVMLSLLASRMPRTKLDCKIKIEKEAENQEVELALELIDSLTYLELDSD